jgi:hypothetical protein
MSTQSYGIAKLHLIFNAMALANLSLHIVLAVIFDEDSAIALSIEVCNLVIKVLIGLMGKRILSVNMKLNKINQLKHLRV